MIDHIGIAVTDIDRATAFYEKALAPLGYTLLKRYPGVAGFGRNDDPDFWIGQGTVVQPVHVAFRADRRSLVDAFYTAAIEAGGKDNGPPGVRAKYHPDYYGAFVHDFDGHNIEAVCHDKYLG
jgi:catechol 2,3-dioxygenase-like lactoylglutathione lyase family enzyme